MKTAFAIRVLALTLVAASSASAALLSKAYEFDTPPDINFYNSTGASNLSVSWCSGGFMEQRTFAVNGAVEYEYPSFSLTGGGLSATNATIIEARINVFQINGTGGVFFQAFDGAYRYSVGLTPTGVDVTTSSGVCHVAKDVYGFHTYRLESPANSPELRFYYDGELVLATNAPAYTTANGFNFGDGTSPSGNGANATWDYARFYQTHTLSPKTLTVVSALGGASPGTTFAASGTAVSAWVTNSPAFNGAAQYVCTGGAVAGNDFTLVSATNVTLVLTNNAVLTWQWEPDTTPVGVTNAVQTAADNSGDNGTSLKLGKAGVLNDGQMAGVAWSVTGSGVLAFDWKVSSEADYDVLRFYEVGSGTTNRISGTGAGWQRMFLTVTGAPAAVHTFRWEYEKDPYGDAVGDDCGWVDAISWAPFRTLTVHGGAGDGNYTNGTPVAVAADAPPAGYVFDRWSGATQYVAGVTAPATTVTMPSADIAITATYRLSALSLAAGIPVAATGDPAAVTAVGDTSGDGATSVKAGGVGLLGDGGLAGIEGTVTGPGVLAFDWKVSSEAGYDWLRCYEVGGSTTNQISGAGGGWARVFMDVAGAPGAVHRFRWEYSKDPFGDYVGDDCGWIDAISWTPKFCLTVNSGSGDGWYTNGTAVAIAADPPPANQKFSRWSGDTNGIANVLAPSTTLSAPATNATVTALYVSTLHALAVSGGSGGGVCAEGQTVGVTADPDPLYMEFDAWTGDAAGLLADASARSTSLVMPMRDAALASTYRKSLARVAGCYGRTLTASGTAGGVNTDATAGSPDGTPAIKLGGAGIVPDNGFAAFETVVSGSGTVTFCWRVSSESNADYLMFKVDGAQVAAISGTKGSWAHVTNRVEGAGATHTLRWEYVKNGSLASSTDAGWVDDIVWTGDVPDPAIVPDVQAVAASNGLFVIRFLGERGIPYSIYSNATLDANGWAVMDVVPQEKGETNGLFRFEAAVMLPAGQRAGFYRVFGGKAQDQPYLVIDLSGGTAAASYPVTYLNAVPAGGWSDEYKTTRLVMRRVQDGIFTMGSPTNEMGHAANETLHTVTLTKGFYIGVFEVTQKQWERVMGTWPSYFNNASYRDARPVEQVSYNHIRGSSAGAGWPATDSVDATSFMGRMRAKTGQAFDLPTESQWEYACRAGTASALNSGANLTNTVADASVAEVGRYRYNGGLGFTQTGDTSKGSAKVGGYQPNAWGLYDMHGNVWEFCLDWNGTYPDAAIDPKGAESGSGRLSRGGGWLDYPDRCRSAFRGGCTSDYTTHILGFRVAIVLP